MRISDLRMTIVLIVIMTCVTSLYADTYYKVTATSLNVRKSPSMGGTVFGKVYKDETVDVISIVNNWAKIRHNNTIGYLYAKYIEVTEDHETDTPDVAEEMHEPYNRENGLDTSDSQSSHSVPQNTENEDRKTSWLQFGYFATNFDYVKESGHYGFGWTALYWQMAPSLYAGFHFSPVNFNFGLVDIDYTSDIIMLGPAIGYSISPNVLLSTPLDVMCNVFYDSNSSKTHSVWLMSLSPTVFIGRNYGVYLGLMLTIPFESSSKVTCGFNAGIFF